MAVDYMQIFNSMQDGVIYTAKDLGVAAASLNAMVTRQMVKKVAVSPCRYCKLAANRYTVIMQELCANSNHIYFKLMFDCRIPMLCHLKNGHIMNCWDEPYEDEAAKAIAVEYFNKDNEWVAKKLN